MALSKVIEPFKSQINLPAVLYVDVYPYIISSNKELLLLILKRRNDVLLPGDWQVVCGKIKEGEKIKDAFLRQVKNKTGQIPCEVYKLDFINTFYDEYYDSILMVPCAAAKLRSNSIQIDSNLHVEYKWATYTEAYNLLSWENQKKCLDFVQSFQNKPSCYSISRLVYKS